MFLGDFFVDKFNDKTCVDLFCKYEIVFLSECWGDKSNYYEDYVLRNVFDIYMFHRSKGKAVVLFYKLKNIYQKAYIF